MKRKAALISNACALLVLGAIPARAQTADAFEEDLLALLNTPVVSASKTAEKLTEAPATMIVISKKDIERRGYTKFWEILEDLPGFDNMLTYGDTFYKTYARGFRNNIGDSMLVMVDGKVFNHLWFNTADSALVPLPLSNIERVEVVYGPASAMYGANAFMGVINVITSHGTEKSISMNFNLIAGTSSQKGVDLSWRQNLGKWGYSITVRRYEGDVDQEVLDRYEYTSTKFWRPLLGKDASGNPMMYNMYGKLVNTYGGLGQIPWKTTAIDMRLWAGKLEFGIQHLNDESTYGMHYTSDQYFGPSTKWNRPEWAFFLKFDHEFSQDFTTTATARYRLSGTGSDCLDWWTGWDSPGKPFCSYPEYWAEQSSSMDFNQDFQWNAMKQLTFNFGYVLSQEVQQVGKQKPDGSFEGYIHGDADRGWIDNRIVQPGDAGPAPTLSLSDAYHRSILRRGAYMQAKFRLNDQQSLLAGIRDDWHATFKEAVTVRGGYVGNWGGFNLKALYGQAFQEPTPRQLYGSWTGAGASTALQPMRSWTMELGAGYTTSRWNLSADLYKIRNSNLILTMPGGTAANAGVMNITGLDLHGQLQFPGVLGKELRVWGYLTNTLKATGDPYNIHLNALNSDDIGDIAKTKLNIGMTALLNDSMSLTLKGRQISARDVVATNPVKKVDAYNTFEMYFQYMFVKGFSGGLKITNLTDAKYFQPGLADAAAGLQTATIDASGLHGSKDWHTSLLPQMGRAFEVMLRYQF